MNNPKNLDRISSNSINDAILVFDDLANAGLNVFAGRSSKRYIG